MVGTLKQARSPCLLCLLLTLMVRGSPLVPASGATDNCSGYFVVEDSTVKLFVQQYVNSSEDAVECRYTFEAPRKSGLLIIANDIRAVNDGEIPGCPVSIYNNDGAYGDPLFSLCGHYTTMTIPVPSPLALLVYKPELKGTAYTLTLDLQVASTGGSHLRACGDSQLNVLSLVPIRYSVGFRADAGSDDASDSCDINVRSTNAHETLGTNCVLTSDGVCNYDVLLGDGSAAPSKDYVDLATGGGSATVRLHPAGISGVLISKVPAGFVPVSFLEPPLTLDVAEESISSATDLPGHSSVDETHVSNVQTVINDDADPGLWNKTKHWFRKAWKSVKNATKSAFRSVRNWFNG